MITQPDFWPWLGFFDKVLRADEFIFLDHVVNRPSDGILTKRVRILLNGRQHWFSTALKRDKDREFVPIAEMLLAADPRSDRKAVEMVRHAYSGHPHFAEIFPLVQRYFEPGSGLVAERNIEAISEVCAGLKIPFTFGKSSALNPPGSSNEMLVNLVKSVGGTEYLYGSGSIDYLDRELWDRAGIRLVPQGFVHPVYEQIGTGPFVGGLSIIDALMNAGFAGVRDLLIRHS